MSEDEEDKPEGMAFVAAENNELRAEISRVKALQNIGASIPKTEGGDQSALADEAARKAQEEKAAEEEEELPDFDAVEEDAADKTDLPEGIAEALAAHCARGRVLRAGPTGWRGASAISARRLGT